MLILNGSVTTHVRSRFSLFSQFFSSAFRSRFHSRLCCFCSTLPFFFRFGVMERDTTSKGSLSVTAKAKRESEKRHAEKRNLIAIAIHLAQHTTMSDSAIARRLKKPQRTVSGWLIRYRKTGQVEDKGHSGRPTSVSPQIGKSIVESMERKRFSSTRSVSASVKLKGVNISASTIGRYMHRSGYRPYHTGKTLFFKPTHRKKRLEFIRKYLRHPWSRTVFSDEKNFLLFPPINHHNDVVWTSEAQPQEAIVERYCPQVRVWGAISSSGKSKLIVYEGTLSAERYIHVLEEALPSLNRVNGSDWIFQQDGAAPHRAAITMKWIDANFPKYIPKEDWPAKSPDLNPIENVWGWMDTYVKKKEPKNRDELLLAVQSAWRAVPQLMIKSLIRSMPRRMLEVKARNGAKTHY